MYDIYVWYIYHTDLCIYDSFEYIYMYDLFAYMKSLRVFMSHIYVTYIYVTYICVHKYISHIFISHIYVYVNSITSRIHVAYICHIYIYVWFIYIYVTYIYIYIYICHTCIYVWFSWIYTITSHVGCETRTILAKTDRVPWIDWFWSQGWLNTKGPICTGTAPLFWNFISLFERPRTRRKSKSVYCRSFSAKKLLIIGLFCRK